MDLLYLHKNYMTHQKYRNQVLCQFYYGMSTAFDAS